MNGNTSLTFNDLTLHEANTLILILDASRSGKPVQVIVGEAKGHTHGNDCADGSCSVPQVSEPVPIETPYKPNDEVVEATYETDEKKPKRARKVKKAPKAKKGEEVDAAQAEAFPEPSGEPAVVAPDPTPEPAPAPVVAVPALTKVDVDNAMGRVAKFGMTRAKSLLTEFAVARTRDLPPEQYAKFIARADEIAGK